MYELAQDIEQKLSGTIILYDGKPIFVKNYSIIEDGEHPVFGLSFKQLPSIKGNYCVPINDPLLDFRGISERLGFINGPIDALWVYRIPIRKSIQGLKDDNTGLSPSIGGQMVFMDWSTMVFTPAFVDMIANNYPSMKDARKEVTGGKYGCAFHRTLAFARSHAMFMPEGKVEPSHKYNLNYKGLRVAFSDDLKTFHLDPKFSFMKEIMDYHGIEYNDSKQAA